MKIKLLMITLLLSVTAFGITFAVGSSIKAQRNKEIAEINAKAYREMEPPPPVKILNFDQLPKAAPNRDQLLDRFLDTVDEINKEKLPFDEPRHEVKQQDGFLRPKWRDAYFTKKLTYEFNGDTYYVYRRRDDNNKLYVFLPQVCSDYLVDSIDRSFGNWYYPSPRRPHRLRGKFSIRKEAKEAGYNLRRLRELVQYMKDHPEDYEFTFEGIGLPIGNTNLLNKWLIEAAGADLGSIIIISGRVHWDRKQHSHSFIVSKMEDGFIKRISGNAGMAREWGLSRESRRTPLRTVRYVIRLKDSFLKEMYVK